MIYANDINVIHFIKQLSITSIDVSVVTIKCTLNSLTSYAAVTFEFERLAFIYSDKVWTLLANIMLFHVFKLGVVSACSHVPASVVFRKLEFDFRKNQQQE